MDDFVEPTEEEEFAGRMDAAGRAARLEDGISRRRQERRLLQAMVTAPAAGAAPDLNQLRELLTAVKNDPLGGLPWWLDSAPGGADGEPDGTTDVGGIIAGWDRTVHDHTGAAVGTEPAINELGSINPPLAEALAVAAVNALPWLLAELHKARAETLGMTMRGDNVDAWLKRRRDQFRPDTEGPADEEAYNLIDMLLDDYRDHADTGTPLAEDVKGPHAD